MAWNAYEIIEIPVMEQSRTQSNAYLNPRTGIALGTRLVMELIQCDHPPPPPAKNSFPVTCSWTFQNFEFLSVKFPSKTFKSL